MASFILRQGTRRSGMIEWSRKAQYPVGFGSACDPCFGWAGYHPKLCNYFSQRNLELSSIKDVERN